MNFFNKIVKFIVDWWYTKKRYYSCEERIIYYYKDKIHRENGPAMIWDYGRTEWWFHGEKHRIDGPAVYYNEKIYWFYGKNRNLTKEYWYYGRQIECENTEEFKRKIKLLAFI